MIKTYLTLSLFLVVNLFFAQEKSCNCVDELDNISELIKNAKSYKTQIVKSGKEADLNQWREEIKREIEDDTLRNFFCAGYLQKYISFINDRHNQVYLIPEKISSAVPSYTKVIDTLVKTDEISGIYYLGTDQVMVQREKDSVWFGITLKSDSEDWTPGKIRFRINRMPSGNFEIFEYSQNGLLLYQKNIEISEGRIHSTFWNTENKYFFNLNHTDNFTYKSINPSFDYIAIKTLKRTNELMDEGKDFYNKNLDKLTKQNVIIDLRNNGGGSMNQINPLIKALKKNKKIEKIIVLINFKTASSAELATMELKEDKRTILAGENSTGMIEYGYGNRAFSTKTDCSEFKVILSTENSKGKYSNYEYIGIQPDVYLNNKTDWIEQIVAMELNK